MRCVSLENVGELRRNAHAFHTNVDAFRINEDAFHTNFIHAFRINLKLMRAHSPPPLADIHIILHIACMTVFWLRCFVKIVAQRFLIRENFAATVV